MALLYILYQLEADAIVVHINYGKRGKQSDKDATLVEEMAHQWGFDCHTLRPDTETEDREERNFQQWARRFRYDAFRALAAENRADGIAVAHHKDDQVETILQKLFRGSGLESWSAMQVWDGDLFRPLLQYSKQEIQSYCEQRSIPYRVDSSNLESEFARNYLRNEWLHDLENHFPGWKENVLRIADQADLFSKSLQWIKQEITDEQDRISRSQLLHMEPSLVKALILNLLKRVEPGIQVSSEALGQLEHLDTLQTGKSIQLSESYSVLRDREWFKIVFEQMEALTVVDLDYRELKEKPFSYNGVTFYVESLKESPDFGKALYMDAEKISWPLKLRTWRDGDTFVPFGMQGHQKVSDHLTNRKISAAHKRKALVIETFEESICAIIFPPIENRTPPGTISDFAKCNSGTGECLIVK
jgi:tRNA(Ile)-lysidine synthase